MKIINIFLRDLKVNKRDFVTLYILLVPFVLAIIINLLTPSINDTTVNFAMVKDSNKELVSYLKDFSSIEYFNSEEEVILRVKKRDDVFGIKEDNSLIAQGNEVSTNLEFAKTLLVLYENKIIKEDSNATLIDLGETISPLKKLLVNVMMILISIMGGMLIAMNIVEEKADNTISAINVTTISRNHFLLGKSLIGVLLPLYGSIALVYLTGFSYINIFQILLLVFTSSLIAMLIGFFQGVTNDDVMAAAANMKILFLPMAASVAAVEILSSKWQMLFYISPFYWFYKANKIVLENQAAWSEVVLYSSFIVILSSFIYIFLIPKIKKGL